jgi:hypothetical protein
MRGRTYSAIVSALPSLLSELNDMSRLVSTFPLQEFQESARLLSRSPEMTRQKELYDDVYTLYSPYTRSIESMLVRA